MQGSTPYTRQSLADTALSLNEVFDKQITHPLASDVAPTTTALQNQCLLQTSIRFPDASIPYLRDLIISATDILESCGLISSATVCVTLEGLILEMVLATKDAYPKRISRDPPTAREYFQTSEYIQAAKYMLYNQFPMHYKQTIKQTLQNNNNSYLDSHAQLENITPPKIWSLLPFTARTPVPIARHLRNHPQILEDIESMTKAQMSVLCLNDNVLAKEMNEQEYRRYGELIECPVCIDELAFDEFVSCLRGCLVCKSCLGRYIRVGVYESGDLRGKSIECFLEVDGQENRESVADGVLSGEKQKCGCRYSDDVLAQTVGKDVWKVVQSLINERIVREAFGENGAICCGVCGYAEAKDLVPIPKPTIIHITCAKSLSMLLWTERNLESLRIQQYTDHVLLVIMLFTFELILASFLISPLFGCCFVFLVRIFFEVTGLWKQPFELIAHMTRMDPNFIVQIRNVPMSPITVFLINQYNWIRRKLEHHAGQFSEIAIPARPIPFNCKNCLLATCRDCGREWSACHVCHEVEKDSLRLYVEQAMSEAFIRTCPKCMTRFTKQSGCNKMTCPMCAFIMCYVCRKDIGEIGYQHFCQHFRVIPGTVCGECSKCDLYVTKEDESMLEKVAKKAEREWIEQHPQAAGKLLVGSGPSKAKRE
ncbi:hypothetical protein BDR26DRAFT_138032 [Obelidium mucronatum]|nr:hypothetical protein BDR26DRAFT_138032 [Obelidium mucronatum]